MSRRFWGTLIIFPVLLSATAHGRDLSAIAAASQRPLNGVVITNRSESIIAERTDPNGRRTEVLRVATGRPGGESASRPAAGNIARPRVPQQLMSHFDEAARRYGLDPALLAAVASVESGFNPRAVSPAGAIGVMQLMPATAGELGVTDPYDPRQNILGGARYLSQMLAAHKGNLTLALASYNAGPGAVRKYKGIPPFEETRNYVAAVQGRYTSAR
jgi:soluble lytic murein transglycosylase-like protein